MDWAFTHHLLDETPDALIVVSPDGRVLFWNRAAESIFGYSSSEAEGAVLSELLVPRAANDGSRGLPATSTSDATIYETVRRRKDGSLVHVNASSRTVRDHNGSIAYVLYTKKDVTPLKVQRDAKLLEARFGVLLESTPDAIVIVNVTGRMVLANSQAGRLFGYDRSELIGKPIEILLPERFRLIHNSHRSGFFAQPHARAMGRGAELFGVRSSGEEFPVEISLSPLETEEGAMVMSAVRDITDRKKAEQKFKGLLESAPDAMVIVGRDGRIALVNTRTEQLFGYRREELLGQPVEMLVPERYREKHVNHRGPFFAQPRARSMGAGLNLQGLRRDGSEFPVEISLSPLETEDGIYVSSAIRDATERRRFERTLQDANRLKSEFLANMSHELRTPLNGIIGFSELLIDEKPGALNAKQKEYLSDVLASGRHLLRLINDVLDLSKVEAGKMELFPESFALEHVLDEVCAVVSPIAGDKSIAITKRIAPAAEHVMLDRQKFAQVLYNLVSNALKFTDAGEVRVDADVIDGDNLRIAVRDSGIGIRPEDIPKLFVEFQQLDSGTTRRYEGTGLGLALTKRLVEFQGGTIDVQSAPGKGSTFTVTLPLPAPPNGRS